jgi:tetratricopeptide (TPR) repeat protein
MNRDAKSYETVFSKEVRDVYQENQAVAQFLLRVIRSTKAGEPRIELPSFVKSDHPFHLAALLRAATLQLAAFSGGELRADIRLPLWLELLHRGVGLRALTPDLVRQADHLLAALGLPSTDALAERHLRHPGLAYRLAKFEHATRLLERASDLPATERNELAVRILARGGSGPGDVARALAQVGSAETRLRILAALAAQAAKQGDLAASALAAELSEWLSSVKASPAALEAHDPLMAAQVINSLNLVLLKERKWDEVAANLALVGERVIPRIARPDTRDHVEGNYLFQLAIMRRIAGDTDGELDLLQRALAQDHGFATAHYRIAQLLHDRSDARAEASYLRALSLSPFDFPCANDYGCFLSDTGQEAKLADWGRICEAIFPEGDPDG